MNLESELNLAIDSARQAGRYLKELSSVEVLSSKGKDIKLKADIESEQIILSILSQTGYKTISEEQSPERVIEDDSTWVIDPLDGSLNFYRRIPSSAISIALWNGLEPLLGVVYDFNRDEIYSGVVGRGAYVNNQKISVSRTDSRRDAIISIGFPSHSDHSKENLSAFIHKIQKFKKIRLLGSAALSLAYVASGKIDAYSERGIMLWDVAAGLALVKSAGGDFEIERVKGNQFNVWASNGKIKR